MIKLPNPPKYALAIHIVATFFSFFISLHSLKIAKINATSMIVVDIMIFSLPVTYSHP